MSTEPAEERQSGKGLYYRENEEEMGDEPQPKMDKIDVHKADPAVDGPGSFPVAILAPLPSISLITSAGVSSALELKDGLTLAAGAASRKKGEDGVWLSAVALPEDHIKSLLATLEAPEAWKLRNEQAWSLAGSLGRAFCVRVAEDGEERELIIVHMAGLLLTYEQQPTSVVKTIELHVRSRGFATTETLLSLLLSRACSSCSSLTWQRLEEVTALVDEVQTLDIEDANKILEQIMQVRARVLRLAESVFAKQRLLLSLDGPGEEELRSARLILDDAISSVQHMQDTLATAVTTYLARLSLANAKTGLRTQVISRHLTSVFAVALPSMAVQAFFTMVCTSFSSQNVTIPGLDPGPQSTPYNYDWFIGLIVFQLCLGVLIVIGLKRLGWL